MEEISVNIQDLVTALKIDEKVLDVAKKVVYEDLKYRSRSEPRQTGRRWEIFKRFADITQLPYEEAIKAAEGKLDKTYISTQQISRQRIQAEQRLVVKMQKELEKANAYTQNIVDIIMSEFGQLPAVPYKKKTDVSNTTPETAMLELSDWHMGSYWKNEDTGFGDMSTNILGDRIELLTTKVIGLVNLQRKAVPIPKLHINMLGDLVENDSLHHSSGVQVDQPTIRQFVYALNAAERMLISLLSEFDTISVAAVAGNHGRMGKKGEQHFQNNWDQLLYHMLAERFANEDRLNILIATVPYMAFMLEDQPEWVHCIQHGDCLQSPLGIPYYSVQRNESRMVSILDRPIHYNHLAHFHQIAQIDKLKGAVIINGSITGSTPFGISLRLAGQAKQILMGMHPEYGQTWVYHVHLSPMHRTEHDENGVFTPYVMGLEGHIQ